MKNSESDPLSEEIMIHLLQVRDGYIDLWLGLDWKIIHITVDAASANEEPAAAFLAELNQLIKEKGYHSKQIFSWEETGLTGVRCPKEPIFIKAKRRYQGRKHRKAD